MNNDFNYRPSQPKPQVDPSETKEAPDVSESQEQTPAETPAPTPHVITSDNRGSGAKKLLAFLGVLILLTAAAGGVYYWQHKKVTQLESAQTDLQNQISTLKAAGKVPAKGDGSTTKSGDTNTNSSASVSSSNDVVDIITGAPTKLTANEADVVVDYSFKNMPTEVWVESGAQPDSLTTVSAHQKTSSEGNSTYGAQGFALTGLKAQTVYYYRAAGTINGKTVYGGIVSFATTKAQ